MTDNKDKIIRDISSGIHKHIEKELDKDSWLNENVASILAVTCVTFILLILSYVIYSVINGNDIPDKSESLITLIIGGLTSTLTGIVSYFFGSSKSSAKKDKLIKKQP